MGLERNQWLGIGIISGMAYLFGKERAEAESFEAEGECNNCGERTTNKSTVERIKKYMNEIQITDDEKNDRLCDECFEEYIGSIRNYWSAESFSADANECAGCSKIMKGNELSGLPLRRLGMSAKLREDDAYYCSGCWDSFRQADPNWDAESFSAEGIRETEYTAKGDYKKLKGVSAEGYYFTIVNSGRDSPYAILHDNRSWNKNKNDRKLPLKRESRDMWLAQCESSDSWTRFPDNWCMDCASNLDSCNCDEDYYAESFEAPYSGVACSKCGEKTNRGDWFNGGSSWACQPCQEKMKKENKGGECLLCRWREATEGEYERVVCEECATYRTGRGQEQGYTETDCGSCGNYLTATELMRCSGCGDSFCEECPGDTQYCIECAEKYDAESFEAEVCPCGCAMVGCVCSSSCKGECLGAESFEAEWDFGDDRKSLRKGDEHSDFNNAWRWIFKTQRREWPKWGQKFYDKYEWTLDDPHWNPQLDAESLGVKA